MISFRACARIILSKQNVIANYTALRKFHRTLAPTLVELTRRKKKHASIQPTPIRSNFLEWNRAAEIFAFNSRLSEKFDMQLLDQAFTHRTYKEKEEHQRAELGIENAELNILDNTNLINEGRELLPKIIRTYLSRVMPLVPRECIEALTEYLLSTKHLSYTSSGIGTKDLILCSTHPVPDEILADTFYALVSALHKSVDISRASYFVRDILIATLVEKDLTEIWCPEEPFKVLNDILLRAEMEPAEPRLVAQSGSNTLMAVCQIAMYSKKQFLGIGVGNTVEDAQAMAAINSLLRLFHLMDYDQPIRCNKKFTETLEQPIPNMPLNEWMLSKNEI